MKYEPKVGKYEEGLTARLMYDKMHDLLSKHITDEDFKRLEKHNLDPGKLWENIKIRSEISDFIISYFFTDLNEPVEGFKDIFTSDLPFGQSLRDYVKKLEEKYDDKDKAKDEIKRLITELKKRWSIYSIERDKIINLEGSDKTKRNAEDSFRLLSGGVDGYIQLVEFELFNLL